MHKISHRSLIFPCLIWTLPVYTLCCCHDWLMNWRMSTQTGVPNNLSLLYVGFLHDCNCKYEPFLVVNQIITHKKKTLLGKSRSPVSLLSLLIHRNLSYGSVFTEAFHTDINTPTTQSIQVPLCRIFPPAEGQQQGRGRELLSPPAREVISCVSSGVTTPAMFQLW